MIPARSGREFERRHALSSVRWAPGLVAFPAVAVVLALGGAPACDAEADTGDGPDSEESSAGGEGGESAPVADEEDGEAGGSDRSAREGQGGEGEDTRTLAAAEVLARATEDLELIEEDACEPEAEFDLFTGGPAKRVHYENQLGRATAVLACEGEERANDDRPVEPLRIDFYPAGESDLRYRLYLVERGFDVQLADEDERWVKVCEASACSETGALSEADAERWERGWEEAGGFAGLGERVWGVIETYDAARQP